MNTFEERLARLEEISELIRSGEIPLQEAGDLFEEGMKLAAGLEKELNSVEGRIEKLVKGPAKPGETPVLDLFPELENLD